MNIKPCRRRRDKAVPLTRANERANSHDCTALSKKVNGLSGAAEDDGTAT